MGMDPVLVATWESRSGWPLLTDSRESGVKNKSPTTQLEVKTVLNRIQHFVGFVYQSIRLRGSGGSLRIEVKIEPHRGHSRQMRDLLEAFPGL